MVIISTTIVDSYSNICWSEIRYPDHFLWRNISSSVGTNDEWKKADHPFKTSSISSTFINRELFIFEE